jgi:hypothetical protein
MSIRILPFVAVLFACAAASAATAIAQTAPARNGTAILAATPAPAPAVAPSSSPIEFYLAHGDAGACGPGCSEWIAAEGKIDAAAADRFGQLLRTLKDRRPPIYVHSPGGNINGALLLGRLIRDKKFEVSVGHTVPQGCVPDKTSDSACEAQKRSGKTVEAEIAQTSAQCNSACVYVLAAGVTRRVPPWVKLGIHDAGLDPSATAPNGVALAAGLRLVHARLRNYLHVMGVEDSLFAATLGTPYESVRVLQRDDVVRFGIDRREFGETGWQFVDGKPVPRIRKLFFARTDADPAHFVDGMVDIDCLNPVGMAVTLARLPLDADNSANTDTSTAVIVVNGKPVLLKRLATSNFYARSAEIGLNRFDAVGDDATIELPGIELGRRARGNVTLTMDGFAAAYAKLRPRCLPAPDGRTVSWPPKLQAAASNSRTAALPSNQSQKWGTLPEPLTKSQGSPALWHQSLELTRVAAVEQKLRLDFLYKILPGCSSAGQLTVRVLEQPQHGTISIEKGKAFTDFPKDDERVACNSRESNGTLVFYQPGADYRGADSLTLYVVSPLGDAVTRHYAIDVKDVK